MRRLVLILKNDLKRRLKAPMTIIVLLMIPIVMTGLIGMIFAPRDNKGQQLPKIKVLLVDKDKGVASKFLMGTFDAIQLKEMFQITVVDEKDGHKLIKNGKASALIIIPEKFTDRVLMAEKSELLVIKNPAEQFLPEVVEEFMVTFSVIISGVVQIFETELKVIHSFSDISLENISIPQITPFLENSKQKVVALQKYLNPLLLSLKKRDPIGSPKERTGTEYFRDRHAWYGRDVSAIHN